MNTNQPLTVSFTEYSTYYKVNISIDVNPKAGNYTADDLIAVYWTGGARVIPESINYTTYYKGNFFGTTITDNDHYSGGSLGNMTNLNSNLGFPFELKTTFYNGWRQANCTNCIFNATFNIEKNSNDCTMYVSYFHKVAACSITGLSINFSNGTITLSGSLSAQYKLEDTRIIDIH
ncbi:MAG: hypothetical protein PUG90_00065 [Clostridia bacterium]|nr:hypothetical protein [Clostridia bacterium]MDY4083097.1 hypothetical protein [Eubacteriales bacterium]